MIITGIDPGTTQSAIVTFDTVKEEVLLHGKFDNAEIQIAFTEGMTVACEMVQSFGMPVGAEVFQTVLWIGQFKECCRWIGCDFHLIYRQEIKSTLCNSIKANDAAIRQRLVDLYGPPGTKKTPGKTYGIVKDQWQALAVAVAFSKR